jgi:5'-methylthioadenosine phosphorylase
MGAVIVIPHTGSRTVPTSGRCAHWESARFSDPAAVGGLLPELGPGTFVLPDQLVDRTSGRTHTFYDEEAVHVPFADPYCPDGRAAVIEEAASTNTAVRDGGALVVVEGPRFSTRAESRWFASLGWTVVGMTGYPEAVLARELALCYTCIALVTDLDAGIDIGEGVTQAEVFAIFEANLERLRNLVLGTLSRLPKERTCPCARALDGIQVKAVAALIGQVGEEDGDLTLSRISGIRAVHQVF